MSTIESERDKQPFNSDLANKLKKAIENPDGQKNTRKSGFDYSDSSWIDEQSVENLANALVLQLDLQEEVELGKFERVIESRPDQTSYPAALSKKRDRGKTIFTNSVDVAAKIAGGLKPVAETRPIEEKKLSEKRLSFSERAEQSLESGNLTAHEKLLYFVELDFAYRKSQIRVTDLEDIIADLRGRASTERDTKARDDKQKLIQDRVAELKATKEDVKYYQALLKRIDLDRFVRYQAAEKKGLAQTRKQSPVEVRPKQAVENPKSVELGAKLAQIETDMASFEQLLETDDLEKITASYRNLENHVDDFLNHWKNDDKEVNAELAEFWDAQNGMGQRFVAAERAYTAKAQLLGKKSESGAGLSPVDDVNIEPAQREGIRLTDLNYDYLRSDREEPSREPRSGIKLEGLNFDYLKSQENQEAAAVALLPEQREIIAERVAVAVATGTALEIAADNRIAPAQKAELEQPAVQEAIKAEITHRPGYGGKLKSFLLSFAVGAGAGFLARSVARRAMDVVFPGSAAVVGGVGGAAAESARTYLAERKRKKEAAEYVRSGDEGIKLAARYVQLSEKLAKNPASPGEFLGDYMRLQDLAVEIKSKDLKNVRGGDLLKKLVSIREGAATEILGQNKEAKKLLDALKTHYSVNTSKKRLAKAALRGGLIGAAGGAVGGMIADYLAERDVDIVQVMEHGKDKLTLIKGTASAGTPDVLPLRRTVWDTAKNFLRAEGIDPNNTNVLKAVQTLTEANEVDVTEWGETGRAMKDIAMQDSHRLKGFHEVLKLFGKNVAEGTVAETADFTPGRVVAKLVDNAQVQDFDLRKILAITGSALGADYLWHKWQQRGGERTKSPSKKADLQGGPIVRLRGGGGGGAAKEAAGLITSSNPERLGDDSRSKASEKFYSNRMKRLAQLENQLNTATTSIEINYVIKALVDLNREVTGGEIVGSARKIHRQYRIKGRVLMEKARAKEESFKHQKTA